MAIDQMELIRSYRKRIISKIKSMQNNIRLELLDILPPESQFENNPDRNSADYKSGYYEAFIDILNFIEVEPVILPSPSLSLEDRISNLEERLRKIEGGGKKYGENNVS